jgi:hypothetical protein
MQTFRSSEIVVWLGIICTFSTIKDFYDVGDEMWLADRLEIAMYLKQR